MWLVGLCCRQARVASATALARERCRHIRSTVERPRGFHIHLPSHPPAFHRLFDTLLSRLQHATMAPGLNLPPPTQGSSSEDLHLISTSKVDGEIFPTGGVVYPPPDLRPIIDKTAEFVARNGVAFEAKIREQERLNPKFAFLNSGDAYHTYFRLQIRAAAERKHDAPGPADKDRAASAVRAALLADKSNTAKKTEPERPLPHEFSLEFPSTAAVDLEVLKLTALFTARQGQGFASRLMARESRSYQFEFLHPKHPLFSYFHLMVEQYRSIMQPSKERIEHIQQCASRRRGPGAGGARMHVLDEVRKRATWTKWDEERRQQEHDEEARQRALFDEIDWQDFCVVGVVEVTTNDASAELPPPRSLYEMQSMVLTHKKMSALHTAERSESNEQKTSTEASTPATSMADQHNATPAGSSHHGSAGADAEAAGPSSLPAHDTNTPTSTEGTRASVVRSTAQGPVKIRHDYVRGARPAPSTAPATTVCPVCGDTVAVNDMSEHVRIELLNPKFREQRAQMEQRRQEQASLAAGADPSHFLRQFAGARTDIFGVRADEEAQARREASERRLAREKEKNVWDGHLNSSKTAQDARARSGDIDQQLAQMRARPAPAATTATPIGPQVPSKRPTEEPLPPQPPSKRRADERREEGAPRYAEQEWLAMYPHPITLRVHVPDATHIAPACDGHVEEISGLSLSTTIGQVRDRILSETLGKAVGASKLKMWVQGKPATLRQSLAYWNLMDGAHVEMSLAK